MNGRERLQCKELNWAGLLCGLLVLLLLALASYSYALGYNLP